MVESFREKKNELEDEWSIKRKDQEEEGRKDQKGDGRMVKRNECQVPKNGRSIKRTVR